MDFVTLPTQNWELTLFLYKLQHSIATQLGSDFNFYILLSSAQNYSIIIHDSNNNLFATNQATIPHILLTMDDNKSQIIIVKVIHHRRMIMPDQPCEFSIHGNLFNSRTTTAV